MAKRLSVLMRMFMFNLTFTLKITSSLKKQGEQTKILIKIMALTLLFAFSRCDGFLFLALNSLLILR